MDKLWLAEQNLGQVFNSRLVRSSTPFTLWIETKQPNLKLAIWQKQLLGSLPLAFVLPSIIYSNAPVVNDIKYFSL
jgi:hypothetical protein